jgi:hypothetical protein
MNELVFGASNKAVVEAVKWTLELLITVLLVVLFHWRYTQHFAVFISGGLFLLYLFVAPGISMWVPEFRDYALAVMVAFAIEVWIKAGVHNLFADDSHDSVHSPTPGSSPVPPTPVPHQQQPAP